MRKNFVKNIDEGLNEPSMELDGWQITTLKYSAEYSSKYINRIDIHKESKKIFILIIGRAVLITSKQMQGHLNFKAQIMKCGIDNIIPKNTWHNIAMLEGSKVIVIEPKNAHLKGHESYHLKDEEQGELRSMVRAYLENCN